MIAPSQIKKPSNWQDFEKLCKLLWGEVWCCEDTIKRHGRQGQNQHGVDVYAYVDKYNGYCGIQCKGKDDYTMQRLLKRLRLNQNLGSCCLPLLPIRMQR